MTQADVPAQRVIQMRPVLAWLLIREVKIHCTFALAAFSDLHTSLRVGQRIEAKQRSLQRRGTGAVSAEAADLEDRRQRTQLQSFRALQGCLVHAGQVSQLFFVADRAAESKRLKKAGIDRKAIAAELREVLGVAAESVIASRALRDHLIHYDERLIEWATDYSRTALVDMSFGSIDEVIGIEPDDFHRNLDTTKMEFRFRTDTLQLTPLQLELERIEENATRFLAVNPAPPLPPRRWVAAQRKST